MSATGSTSSARRRDLASPPGAGDRRPAGHGRRARLQPLRGELRALPRPERPRPDEPDAAEQPATSARAERPGEALRPPERALPAQRPDRRRPLRLRQRELAMPVWSDNGNPPGPLNYRQIDELIAFLRATNDHDVRSSRTPSTNEPIIDPATGKVKTFTGWRDPNYKPAPAARRIPDCYLNALGRRGRRRRGPAPGGSINPNAPVVTVDRAATAPQRAASTRPTLEATADTAFTLEFDNRRTPVRTTSSSTTRAAQPSRSATRRSSPARRRGSTRCRPSRPARTRSSARSTRRR